MKFLRTLLLLLLPALAAADDERGTLIIRIDNPLPTEGEMRFALFDSEEHFLDKAVRFDALPITANGVAWVVNGLPYGTYAVSVHHDINGDGKMDRRWYGKPSEPVGVSNNPKPRMGPPRYKDARFEFTADGQTLNITLQ